MVSEIFPSKQSLRRSGPGLSRLVSLLGAWTFILVQAVTAQVVQPNVIVSVREQRLMLLQDGYRVATFPVSTSKFGIGNRWNSMATPTGFLQVAQKIGDHAPVGAVFHNRRFTGEILTPNAPGRDPVITRIIWLRGLEAGNANAFSRCIYIHGTPEEKTIGRPASFGCVRMKSADVAQLYANLPIGAVIRITPDALPRVKQAPRGFKPTAPALLNTNSAQAITTAQPSKPSPAKKGEATVWLRNARA